MKLALEDDEPVALSKVEYGLLFLTLMLGAGSFSCHLTAADLGTQAIEHSGYETWFLLLGAAAGVSFFGFAGLVGRRLLPGKQSRHRRRKHRHGSHRHRSRRHLDGGQHAAHGGD